MPQYFQRPENALKRAKELLEVGKKQDALDCLHDTIKSRKSKGQWTKVHEQIMRKHLELCVDLRKPHTAKDGLFQYRNMCQQINVKSLEDVVIEFLKNAEKRTDEARSQSLGMVDEVIIDDLDQADSPETLLLKAVSGEGAQDRADRAVLSPWLRFLWESYRQCLELLRNNQQVETLYHRIAKLAFSFCLKYQRKSEFKKLCDNLRTHLNQLQKMQHQTHTPKLTEPETLVLHQDTRLHQLDIAIQMELCLATRVLLAVLSIQSTGGASLLSRYLEMEETHLEHQRKLSSLLILTAPPTRQSLLKDLLRVNVMSIAMAPAKGLYRWMEQEFAPLKLASETGNYLDQIEALESTDDEYARYVGALKEIISLKILKQISQVYESMKLERLKTLIPFYENNFQLEHLVVTATKKAHMQARLDQRSGCIKFGDAEGVGKMGQDQETGDSQLDIYAPEVQNMPNEQVRVHLQHMYQALSDAVRHIDASKEEALLLKEIHDKYEVYKYHANDHHKRIMERKKRIESYKEQAERVKQEKDRQEKFAEERAEKVRQKEEEVKLQRERREIDEQKKQAQLDLVQETLKVQRLQRLRDTETGRKMIEQMGEQKVIELDTEQLLEKQVSQLEYERRSQEQKQRLQERRFDYHVRACHIEEMPLVEQEYEDHKDGARVYWEQHEVARCERLEQDRQSLLQHHERLLRVEEDAETFVKKITADQKNVTKQKLAEFEKMLKEERVKRMKERKDKRKQDRKEKAAKDQKEKEETDQREQMRAIQDAHHNQDDGRQKKMGRDRDRERDEDRKPEPDNWREAQRAPSPVAEPAAAPAAAKPWTPSWKMREEGGMAPSAATDQPHQPTTENKWRDSPRMPEREQPPSGRDVPDRDDGPWRRSQPPRGEPPMRGRDDRGTLYRSPMMSEEGRQDMSPRRGPPPSHDGHDGRDSDSMRYGAPPPPPPPEDGPKAYEAWFAAYGSRQQMERRPPPHDGGREMDRRPRMEDRDRRDWDRRGASPRNDRGGPPPSRNEPDSWRSGPGQYERAPPRDDYRSDRGPTRDNEYRGGGGGAYRPPMRDDRYDRGAPPPRAAGFDSERPRGDRDVGREPPSRGFGDRSNEPPPTNERGVWRRGGADDDRKPSVEPPSRGFGERSNEPPPANERGAWRRGGADDDRKPAASEDKEWRTVIKKR